MPNWVINKIKTSQEAISLMLNEKGNVDFEKVFPYPCKHDTGTDGYFYDAMQLAKHHLLDGPNFHNLTLERLNPEARKCYEALVANYKDCGYFHDMDFASEVWGTKWNACETHVDGDMVVFETAWAHPLNVVHEWSRKMPDVLFTVQYADEDTGSNCGEYTMLNGEMQTVDIAPNWRHLSNEREKWKRFACDVWGREYE